MEFKKYEWKPEGNGLKRLWANPQYRKTVLYTTIGALAGFLFFYFTEGMHMDAMPSGEIYQSLMVGAFMGFFITNSPCAKGKC